MTTLAPGRYASYPCPVCDGCTLKTETIAKADYFITRLSYCMACSGTGRIFERLPDESSTNR